MATEAFYICCESLTSTEVSTNSRSLGSLQVAPVYPWCTLCWDTQHMSHVTPLPVPWPIIKETCSGLSAGAPPCGPCAICTPWQTLDTYTALCPYVSCISKSTNGRTNASYAVRTNDKQSQISLKPISKGANHRGCTTGLVCRFYTRKYMNMI